MKHKGKPTFLLSADWHLRSNAPSCRTDEYYETMFSKVRFIIEQSKKYNVPILVAGDFGHVARWEIKLLSDVIQLFRFSAGLKIFVAPGQHDLPNHRLDKIKYSGIGVLDMAGAISVIEKDESIIHDNIQVCSFPYGVKKFNAYRHKPVKAKVALMHRMVIKDRPLWKGQKCITAKGVLKAHPEYRLIVTGDNHIPFVEMHKGRLLVNCGSMMRTTTSQKDHRPRIYLWYSESNTVEKIFIPTDKNVIQNPEKQSRGFDIFVDTLQKEYEVDISFEANIKRRLNRKKVSSPVREKIYRAMGG